ncbi:MAG: dTMP kinase, partial [Acidimicrobiia bacterium]
MTVGSPRRGRLVVIEGPDGCGKTTQAARLVERLRLLGREVVGTFEPGATPTGALLRAVVLDRTLSLDPRAEALLMAADRAQHVASVIRPALERGADVVTDRFSTSTLAYQGIARGLGLEAVESLCDWATDGLRPDLVVLLDVGEGQLASRRGPSGDRLEDEPQAFHARVRRAYGQLAERPGHVSVSGEGQP